MKNEVQTQQEVVQMHTYRKTDREVDAIDGYTKGCNFLKLLHVDYLEMSTIYTSLFQSTSNQNATAKNRITS
jgi:hypothetical protein